MLAAAIDPAFTVIRTETSNCVMAQRQIPRKSAHPRFSCTKSIRLSKFLLFKSIRGNGAFHFMEWMVKGTSCNESAYVLRTVTDGSVDQQDWTLLREIWLNCISVFRQVSAGCQRLTGTGWVLLETKLGVDSHFISRHSIQGTKPSN